ncbi:3-ketoacyl-CoA synthase 6-like protein [Drosera capensis]
MLACILVSVAAVCLAMHGVHPRLRADLYEDLLSLWSSLQLQLNSVYISVISLVAIILGTLYYMFKPRKVFLVDYVCYKPPTSYQMSLSTFVEQSKILLGENKEAAEFVKKIVERSGLGPDTHMPPAVHRNPPRPTIGDSYVEAQTTIYAIMDSLFEKTGLRPKDVDILVVNSCIYCPTPSVSATIMNKYKMRSDIKSFNLSGMGCSAGLISVSLARDLLQTHPNSNAVVLSTEIISHGVYTGSERSMLLTNCLFRLGGAAIFLSNKRKERERAKYSLVYMVRTHKGADDRAYNCIRQTVDAKGIVGTSLSKELTIIAGDALKTNITSLGRIFLPASEQLWFALTFVGHKFINPKWKPYIPDFKKAFDHFCIHAGGRAVVDEIQNGLKLSDEQVEGSRMALYKFGNTSSSCLWYVLSYTEAKGRMKKGDRLWQIGLGSGFKCISAVWKCLRTIETPADGPWSDCIDKYPVHIPEYVQLSSLC